MKLPPDQSALSRGSIVAKLRHAEEVLEHYGDPRSWVGRELVVPFGDDDLDDPWRPAARVLDAIRSSVDRTERIDS